MPRARIVWPLTRRANVVLGLLAVLLIIGAIIFLDAVTPRMPLASAPVCPRDPYVRMSVYEVAEEWTGAPAHTLRGIAIWESGERDEAIGDGGHSRGRFQFRDKFRAYWTWKYGPYDPTYAHDAAILAGKIYMDNLRYLGSASRAIAAHNRGADRVREEGIGSGSYVAGVIGGKR